MFQMFPQFSSSCGSHATIGWVSLEAFIHFVQIMFMWRIMLLPVTSLYKRQFLKVQENNGGN